MCTCTIFGTQKECQHVLFVSGLGFEEHGVPKRDFGVYATQKRKGRPKGKAAPKARRLHQDTVLTPLLDADT